MPLFDPIRIGASGTSTGYQIDRSLRMDGTNGYLTRTPTSTGNRKIWTWSGWVKRSRLDNNDYIFSCNSQSGNDGIAAIYWKSGNNKLQFYFDTDGSNPYGDVNDRDYRDVSAWYHIVWQVDASNTTHRIWVNGVEETITGGQPPNYDYAMNRSGYAHAMGTQGWDGHTQRGHMYFAECHYSDGYKYEASDFGEIDSDTGVWSPKEVNINYGTNGFYLKFDDNSNNTAATIGKDSSGNGNNWTPNGISVSAGVGNDSLEDTPTNNFPTFNRLNSVKYSNDYTPIVEEGGLLMRGGDNYVATTFLLPKSGKWYVEFSKYGNGAVQAISVTRANKNISGYDGALGLADMVQYVSNGELGNRSRGSTSDATAWQDDADIVVAIAVDMDNGAVYFARANTWQNSGDPTSGSSKTGAMGTDIKTDNGGDHVIAAEGYNGSDNYGMYVNFGQRAFTYTPPTGYEKLCSANLPDPAVLLPTQHFEPRLYTPNSGNLSVTGFGFQPDLLWLKSRTQAYRHYLFDSVRGTGQKALSSNRTSAEGDDSGSLTSFDSTGFTTSGSSGFNDNGSGTDGAIAWAWNAGGSTVTNNTGSISTQLRANPTAGFSIATYSGNSTGGATLGHGLGVKPDCIIIKTRDATDNWMVYHKGLNSYVDPEDYFLELNGYAADVNSSNMLNDTAPTSSVITISADGSVNSSSRTYVMYSFSEIEGYSKFGHYVGNGNSNGTYVFTGFRPAFVITRGLHGTSWYLWDSKRNTANDVNKELNSNNNQTEATFNNAMDFLSNGFKLRTSNDAFNYNNYNYIYIAFAEAPFRNARAR